MFPMPGQRDRPILAAIQEEQHVLGRHRCDGHSIAYLPYEGSKYRCLHPERDTHRLLAGDVFLCCKLEVHRRPPKSSSATSRSIGISTLAYVRVASSELWPRWLPTSRSVSP